MSRFQTVIAHLRTLLLAGLAGSGAAPLHAQQDPSISAWETAKRIDTVDAYESFLDAYPLSPFADEAFKTIIERSLEAGSSELAGSSGGFDMY